jgi:hypothetical protein
MGEQDLRIDPDTGFPYSDRRSRDAKQNLNYTRHTDPAETARDFSRPHTIPALEYFSVTGHDHGEAMTEYANNQDAARREEEKQRKLAEGA